MTFSNLMIAMGFMGTLTHGLGYRGNRGHVRGDIVSFTVENGTCGNGENYTYFVRPGDPNYVAFIFRGKGFCYNDDTCGPDGSADTVIDEEFNTLLLKEYPQFSNGGPFDSYLLRWTLVLFPQCTEDFHIGFNSIYLGDKTGVFHFQGAKNINLIINEILNANDNDDSDDDDHDSDDDRRDQNWHWQDELEEKMIGDYVNFDNIKHFTVIGISGGSYGASMWSNQLFDYVSDDTLKTLIIDSWWLNKTVEDLVTPILLGLYNAIESPAVSNEILSYILAGDIPLVQDLISINQDRYCDLFVSFLYYEYDGTLAKYNYFFTSNPSFLDRTFWGQIFYNDLLRRYIPVFDSKRTSFYIAQGKGHMAFLDANWTDISTQCEEAPTMNEYVIDVIGDRSLVRKYYGQSTKRVRDFPKYLWNNIDIECLKCADDE